MHRVKKMLRLSFAQNQIPKCIKRLVLHRCILLPFGAAGFCFAHFIHDVLPGPPGKIRVAVLQIDLGDLQIDGRLPSGLVQGVNKALCLVFISCFEACSFSGQGVEGIIDAVFPAELMITLFHSSIASSLSQSVPTG